MTSTSLYAAFINQLSIEIFIVATQHRFNWLGPDLNNYCHEIHEML